MALASKHLAASRPDHPRLGLEDLHSGRGGWMPKAFRGFQLAGELFLLTSFFIEHPFL